jgi:GT2 family glycosyltransferase
LAADPVEQAPWRPSSADRPFRVRLSAGAEGSPTWPARPRSGDAVPDSSRDDRETVSFVIPAYDAAATLATTLDSVLAQTYRDWEAVVVDDGSQDDTWHVAQSYALRDVRIRAVHQGNQGESGARNTGVAYCHGDWLAFLDADDWVSPEYLHTLIGVLQADPTLDAAYCRTVRVAADGSRFAEDYEGPTGDLFAALAQRVVFPVHACLVRRALVEQVGAFDRSLVTVADWDLWLRVARAGAKFGTVRDVLAFYRMSPNSASLDAAQMFRDSLTVIQRATLPDARVPTPHADHAAGFKGRTVASQVYYLLSWSAGLLLGQGRDARHLIELAGAYRDPQLHAPSIARCIFEAAPLANCQTPSAWAADWAAVRKPVLEFLLALEQASGTAFLAQPTLTELDRLVDRCRERPTPPGLATAPSRSAAMPEVQGAPASPRHDGDGDSGDWSFHSTGGSSARVMPVADVARGVRIVIDVLEEGGAPWGVQLNHAGLAVRAGSEYRLEFRGRAAQSRPIFAGVAMAHEPWDGLGFYQRFELTPEWTTYSAVFTATRDEANARIHFDAASHPTAVELAGVELFRLHAGNEVPVTPVRFAPSPSPQPSGSRDVPAFGTVNMGSLRRVTPISSRWGLDRGRAIDRYYIEGFLARHAACIRGHVMEVGDDTYTSRFGGDHCLHKDILHIDPHFARATLIGDLASAPHIPDERFDCVIATQTLQLIYDVKAAIRTLYRILRPGGYLLVTLPGISQTSDPDWGDDWCWSFTAHSAGLLFREVFPESHVAVEARGNVLSAVAFLHGLAAEELTREELEHRAPGYAVSIGVVAQRPSS